MKDHYKFSDYASEHVHSTMNNPILGGLIETIFGAIIAIIIIKIINYFSKHDPTITKNIYFIIGIIAVILIIVTIFLVTNDVYQDYEERKHCNDYDYYIKHYHDQKHNHK